MRRVLLVEDDPGLGTGVKLNLEYEGYEVIWARDLRTARSRNSESQFDLVILDLGLPDGSGISFASGLRDEGSRVPIVILTARTDEDSVVAGLSSGAVDYIRKPFSNRELLARIKIALRERPQRDEHFRFGNVLIMKDQRKVFVDSVEIDLTNREFDVLEFLAENGASVVTRERLMGHLDKGGLVSDRTLDSHLSHIRNKLKRAGVLSVKITSAYGIGYILEQV